MVGRLSRRRARGGDATAAATPRPRPAGRTASSPSRPSHQATCASMSPVRKLTWPSRRGCAGRGGRGRPGVRRTQRDRGWANRTSCRRDRSRDGRRCPPGRAGARSLSGAQPRASRQATWSRPGSPGTSSSASGSSSHASPTRPSSRKRSVSPNCADQRVAAASRSATRSADVVEAGERDHAVTRTGRRLTPLKKFDRSRSGSPSTSIVGHALEQLLEDDADLQPRQVRAQAVVDAARPERHVLVRVARQVHAVRVGEHRLVAVAGREPGDDLRAGRDRRRPPARSHASWCGGSGAPASPSAASPRRRA